MRNGEAFLAARDLLLRLGTDLAAAGREFQWPRLEEFNWVRDYFDGLARDNHNLALRVVGPGDSEDSLTFAQLARRASQVANFLVSLGVRPGDRILLMLGNVVPLWEVMLAAIKLGAVIIPATTLLERTELRDRLERGRIKVVITTSKLVERLEAAAVTIPVRIAVGEAASARTSAVGEVASRRRSAVSEAASGRASAVGETASGRTPAVGEPVSGVPSATGEAAAPAPGWVSYDDSRSASDRFVPQAPTRGDDLLFLYFTSGTTALPKLVGHTHVSYPIGHLSTMYWLGLRPGDVHLNLSSPGWAKHAWSSCFAPWNASACVLSLNYERFDARVVLDQMVRCGVTTFCAPPTVWRMLIQQDLAAWPVQLREAASAGEPLSPEVIECVRAAWGITVRDGFGQTETTAQVGNPPGLPLKPGSMGRPLPGCPVVLVDLHGKVAEEGEVCIDLAAQPVALMRGYLEDPARNADAMAGGYYHTGDIASRDADGYLTYIGRMDDVFKSSDYRISPFELESVLVEHDLVSEAAIVPAPDPVRLCVPKAYIDLVAGVAPEAATALAIFKHCRERVSPYKRIRRLQFVPLPKTLSGKIRRVELRRAEERRGPGTARNAGEFWEEDFPELS